MMMKLWLVQRADDQDFDVLNGAVVRASTAEEARLTAASRHGDEGLAAWFRDDTLCVELTPEGTPGVILTDFNAG